MMIKCPKCGIEYSYGRNICHICKDHSIFFGALFNGDRREHQWNCTSEIISGMSNLFSFELDNQDNFGDAELIIRKERYYAWNCEPLIKYHQVQLSDKNIEYNLIYE